MLRSRSAVAALPLLAVLLTGCATDPRVELRDAVADVTDAANDRDAGDLRGALANLRTEIDSQLRDGQLGSGEADRLLALVQQLEADAGLLDVPEQSPSPSPEESESPSPSPPPSPTRSPTPSPTPEETEGPEETEEPEESESPSPSPSSSDLLPSPVTTTSEPSPTSSPAQAVRDEPSAGPSGA